jgi:Uma2 family endonuclease
MAQQARMLTTVDEFLLWEDGTDTRHELVGGEIVAMAPPHGGHGTVAFNLAGLIGRRLPKGCRGVAEAGVSIDLHNFFVSDLAVTCAGLDDRGMVVEPALIVEVLSPSTRSFDLGAKADAYSQIESVREIWLVDSTRRWLRVWRRIADGWTVTLPIVGTAHFRSDVLGADLSLDEVYADTGL